MQKEPFENSYVLYMNCDYLGIANDITKSWDTETCVSLHFLYPHPTPLSHQSWPRSSSRAGAKRSYSRVGGHHDDPLEGVGRQFVPSLPLVPAPIWWALWWRWAQVGDTRHESGVLPCRPPGVRPVADPGARSICTIVTYRRPDRPTSGARPKPAIVLCGVGVGQGQGAGVRACATDELLAATRRAGCGRLNGAVILWTEPSPGSIGEHWAAYRSRWG